MVICATRGGEGSWAAQNAAIQHAQEHETMVVFLYVVSPQVEAEGNDALLPAVRDELTWLGRTLLELGKKRAIVAGVSAETATLEGNVQQQITAYIRERKATHLFLGAPRGTTSNVFGDDEIEKFALEIAGGSGIHVEVVRPESIVAVTASGTRTILPTE